MEEGKRLMNSLALHQNRIQKFRDEFLSVASPVIQYASDISLAQRWNLLFQWSLNPKTELMDPDLQASLIDRYQVSSLTQLASTYLGNEDVWGAVVAPRIHTPTGDPIACFEHWFVTHPRDLQEAVDAVPPVWPFPFRSIWIPVSPSHRVVSCLKDWEPAHLQERAYVVDRRHSRPIAPSSTLLKAFSSSINPPLNIWWSEFCRMLTRKEVPDISKRTLHSLQKGVSACLETGGVLNLHDQYGLAGHVSWNKGSEPELLIPQCWTIQYIFVRQDLRGRGLARQLYALAFQNMVLDEVPLVCARVSAPNVSSWKALEGVGAERVMEYYAVYE